MRRPRLPVLVAALAVLLAALLAWWRWSTHTPVIEAELSRLAGVADVRAAGLSRSSCSFGNNE